MARINTNVSALTAQIGLAKSQQALNTSLQRLSTGLKINSGADDPAGLIASEGLRSEIAGINQAINNSSEATNVISTAEGSLNEVSNLLLNIKSLIVQGANSGALSQDEISANQIQIDSAIQSITRISNTTAFAGLKLINGSLDYQTSGVAASAIKALSIQQASFGTNANIPVSVAVVVSAVPAQLIYATSTIAASTTLNIQGSAGVTTLSFGAGTSAALILSSVNYVKDQTGVSASFINAAHHASGIIFSSIAYGSRAYVSVTAQTGAFNLVNDAHSGANRATGVNAQAIINGALTIGDGRNIHVNNASLDMNFTLDPAMTVGKTTSFTVTGGGAMFQLGANVNSNQQVSIGIGSVAASSLGNNEVGFLDTLSTTNSLANNGAEQASKILDAAINQVAILRGRLGAFESNTLNTNVNSLQVALENVTSSESDIRDADFAQETSNLTRAQILTQAGTSVLATANSTPQNVLTLLQGH